MIGRSWLVGLSGPLILWKLFAFFPQYFRFKIGICSASRVDAADLLRSLTMQFSKGLVTHLWGLCLFCWCCSNLASGAKTQLQCGMAWKLRIPTRRRIPTQSPQRNSRLARVVLIAIVSQNCRFAKARFLLSVYFPWNWLFAYALKHIYFWLVRSRAICKELVEELKALDSWFQSSLTRLVQPGHDVCSTR